MTLASTLRPLLEVLARRPVREKRLTRRQLIRLLSDLDRRRDYPGSRQRRLTP